VVVVVVVVVVVQNSFYVELECFATTNIFSFPVMSDKHEKFFTDTQYCVSLYCTFKAQTFQHMSIKL
jgi:hypothetical protein